MPSSHPRPTRKAAGYDAHGTFGDWHADGIHAATLSGLHTKLARRDRARLETKAKKDRKRGDSKPDSASGTGGKWFT